MILAVSVLIALSVVCLVCGLVLILVRFPETSRQAALRRIDDLKDQEGPTVEAVALLRSEQSRSSIGLLDRLLARLPRVGGLEDLLRAAGDPFNLGTLVLMSGTLFALGLLGGVIGDLGFMAPLAALGLAWLPVMVLKQIAARRLAVFEEQFPEAVELMVRALRAGHSFGSALKMVADEMAEPVRSEFAKTFDTYSYGKSMDDALTDLVSRVDLEDVKFFVTAVSLQRETGGNLTEILDNIAYIIRERFRLIRTVKALTAEGRLSGIVLAIMAPALLGLLYFLSPEYVNMALEHPVGRMAFMAGGVFEVMGILVIRNMVKLKM